MGLEKMCRYVCLEGEGQGGDGVHAFSAHPTPIPTFPLKGKERNCSAAQNGAIPNNLPAVSPKIMRFCASLKCGQLST